MIDSTPGQQGFLSLFVTNYNAKVKCTKNPTGRTLKSCNDIVSYMPAVKEVESFGPHEMGGHHLELPDTFYSGT